MGIRLDYSNMIGDAVGGISEADWTAASALFPKAHDGFAALRKDGSVGFADIVSDDSLRDQAINFAALVEGKYDDVVILGIGGSALGPIALRTALRPSAWNMLTSGARGISAAAGSRQRRSGHHCGVARPARSLANSFRGHVEVRRHG